MEYVTSPENKATLDMYTSGLADGGGFLREREVLEEEAASSPISRSGICRSRLGESMVSARRTNS
jgi:hypothetical protein